MDTTLIHLTKDHKRLEDQVVVDEVVIKQMLHQQSVLMVLLISEEVEVLEDLIMVVVLEAELEVRE